MGCSKQFACGKKEGPSLTLRVGIRCKTHAMTSSRCVLELAVEISEDCRKIRRVGTDHRAIVGCEVGSHGCNPERRWKKLPGRSLSWPVEPMHCSNPMRSISDFGCEGNRSWFAGDSERCGRW